MIGKMPVQFLYQQLQPIDYLERQQILTWWRRQRMLAHHHKANYYPVLFGGSPESSKTKIWKITYEGQEYTIKVSDIKLAVKSISPLDKIISDKIISDDLSTQSGETMTIALDQRDPLGIGKIQPNTQLLFFSVTNDDNDHEKSCASVNIYPDLQLAEIEDINTLYPCFTALSITKPGRLTVIAVLDYLQTHKLKLNVNQVVLNDQSFYDCQDGFDIRLEYSRQLSGLETYYIQFGFRPILETAREKLSKNAERIRGITVSDKLKIINKSLVDCPNKKAIAGYFVEKSKQKYLLSNAFSELTKINCKWVYCFYKQLFVRLLLHRLCS